MTGINRALAFIGGLFLLPIGVAIMTVANMGFGPGAKLTGIALMIGAVIGMATAFAGPGFVPPMLNIIVGVATLAAMLVIGAATGWFMAWLFTGGLMALAGVLQLVSTKRAAPDDDFRVELHR